MRVTAGSTLKVLQVHNRYRRLGGEDAVVAAERELLESAGHSVETWLTKNPSDAIAATRELVRSPWNEPAARAAVAEAKRVEADVVHVHNTWFSISPLVFPLLAEAGFPVVATLHNYRLACLNALLYRKGAICVDCVGVTPWRGVTRACYRNSRLQSSAVAVTTVLHRRRGTWAKDVDVVVALTDFAADIAVESGVPRHKVVVRPNTIPDPGIRTQPAGESTSVLFAGRISEEKGVLDLLEAWASANIEQLELKIAGSGPLVEACIDCPLPTVEVMGQLPRDDLMREMRRARCVVIASRTFEGIPTVLIEALASGCPVILPTSGPLVGLAGEAAIPFDPRVPGSLRAALEMLGDTPTINTKSEKARQRYESMFSPAAGITSLETIYERAMSSQPF